VVDLKNQADQMIYQTEKQLKEYGDKVPAEVRSRIENAMSNLKEAVKSDNGEAIRRALDNFNNEVQQLGKVLYEEAAKKRTTSGGPKETGTKQTPPEEGEVRRKGGEDVIDAEFEAK
jgi:F0F1-type ATP synthase membrane subunit b/b'